MTEKKKKALAVIGATAVGKTALAIDVARAVDGEIISCDSMQIYRGMDIGSAKPTPEERAAVPHHLIGVIDPQEDFSAAKYKALAEGAIRSCLSRGKTPILCGGTGLYLDAVLYDLSFAAKPENSALREGLYQEVKEKGAHVLYEELQRRDPDAADRIHPNNVKRVIRALESALLGEPIRDFKQVRRRTDRYNFTLILLKRDRKDLYERINRRVDRMVERGLLEEVKKLVRTGLDAHSVAMQGIGYKELLPVLRGETPLSVAVDEIKKNTRHYAKRQETWFRRYADAKVFDLSAGESAQEVIAWLNRK